MTGSSSQANGLPLVSIVVSTFNDQDCVWSAVNSIRSQSLTDWELIAVNDGSTDKTGELLDQFSAEDRRIKVIHQVNSGLTASLIRGCQVATAGIIARQDADDVSHPDRLAMQLEMLNSNSKLGFVSCFANYVGPEGEFLSTVTRNSDPVTATHELLNSRVGPPAHGTVMFRKSVYEQVGGYRLPFFYAQDADLWLRMGEVSLIGYVPKPLYDFRWHPGSITGSGRSVQREFGLLGQRCRQARKDGVDETSLLAEAESLKSRAIAERSNRRENSVNQTSMNYQIGSQLVCNRDARARRYLKKVLRDDCFHVKAWVRLGQSYITCARGTHSERVPT